MTEEGGRAKPARFIAARRGALGLSQRELADRVGLGKSHLSQIESGKIGIPNADVRRRLASALGCTHADLLIGLFVDAGELTADEAGLPAETPDDPDRADIVVRLNAMAPRRSRLDILRNQLRIWLDEDREGWVSEAPTEPVSRSA